MLIGTLDTGSSVDTGTFMDCTGLRRFLPIGAVALVLAGCPEERLGWVAYSWGAEVNTVRPCGGSEVFWVVADSAVLDELVSAHDSLTSRAYQEIFLEAYYKPTQEDAGEFSKAYDGVMRVTGVHGVPQGAPPQECIEGSQ